MASENDHDEPYKATIYMMAIVSESSVVIRLKESQKGRPIFCHVFHQTKKHISSLEE